MEAARWAAPRGPGRAVAAAEPARRGAGRRVRGQPLAAAEPFGSARGEFARNLPHIDRINYKTFSGLVALTWSGFPLRYVIGDPILYDRRTRTGSTTRRSRSRPSTRRLAVAQFTNKDARSASCRRRTSQLLAEDGHQAPRRADRDAGALPARELINISGRRRSAPARTLISKVRRYHRPLGESREDVTRLMLRVKDPADPRGFDQPRPRSSGSDPESPLARRARRRGDEARLDQHARGRSIMAKVLGRCRRRRSTAWAERPRAARRLLTSRSWPGVEQTSANGNGAPVAIPLAEAHIEAERRLRDCSSPIGSGSGGAARLRPR
jgi:hypothetical protein